jgi:polysaccharide deacetylase
MKESKLGHGLIAIVLAWAAFSAGCGKGTENSPSTGQAANDAPAKKPTATAADNDKFPDVPDNHWASEKRVTDRPANPNGKVFILEYHHIREGKGDMFRTTGDFREDLERLYKDGFRPCTVSDYLSNKMPLPPGASPAVFTFDDANPSQIKLRPDGSVDPDCAVGIWQEFAKEHPDFPVRATFFVLPTMWGQSKMLAQKVALVKQLGCELADHTITHPILSKLSDEKVKREIGEAADNLEKLGTPMPVSLALPFGVSPKNKKLLESFDYNGKHYEMKGVLLVGAEPARSPLDPKFNKYRIPRVQAYSGPFGINEWLDKFEKGSVKVYVAP